MSALPPSREAGGAVELSLPLLSFAGSLVFKGEGGERPTGCSSQRGSRSLGQKGIKSTEWVLWKGPSSYFTKMAEFKC